MSHLDVIRAWKDEEYRASLSEAERAQLPGHPAGLVELSEDDIDLAAGGTTITITFTVFICPTYLCTVNTVCPFVETQLL